MIRRNAKGSLTLNNLDAAIGFGYMFEECKDREEIDWLEMQLHSLVDSASEERLQELEDEEDESEEEDKE